MQYDDRISVASGLSVNSKSWKNKEWLWSDLVKKLSKAQKTGETYKEYCKATKPEKSKIKDVGGYVGAYLRGSRKQKKNVASKQLITLDLDFAHLDFWEVFSMVFDNAAVLHSTHSHSEKKPRYRLIMPLSREVSPDEYVAIARKIAGILGIDLFDNTTFETSRLMFWPSVSKDMDYYFEQQDGTWVDADEILGMYKDWKDCSLWPTSNSQLVKIRGLAEKQEDPEEKKGVVGSFCRAYTIQEVLAEYLSGEYEEAYEGRYTYCKGSTAAGLVIYEDKFTFSHHGTDPCSGKLCNAFDLVRLHKYGHLDEDSRAKGNKLGSFKAMQDLARKDKRVRKIIADESIKDAKYDFAPDYEDPEQDEDVNLEWATDLEVDAKGKYLSSANNLNLIISNDSRLKSAFRLNTFDNKRYLFSSVPWRKIKRPEPVKNVDYSGVRNYIESVYSVVGNLKIDDCLALEFERQKFNPVKDYLSSLEWDGEDRAETLLIDYLGAEDNLYTRQAIRKTLTGAVARIYRPGIKFDLALILVGKQGAGKSMFAQKLGKSWFSDTFTTIKGKEAFEQLQGAWIIEMAELAGLRKADVEPTKHFISKQEDTFRPAYARAPETFKRQCIFIGTTNTKDFLTDPTGNRRFMPIDTDKSKATKSIWGIEDSEIDQIWAEAVHLYESGEKLYLDTEAAKMATIEQKKHSKHDERSGIVEQYLNTALPSNWDTLILEERIDFLEDRDSISKEGISKKDYVCVAEIWCECLGRSRKDMDRYKTRDIHEIMRSLEDWERSKSTKNFKLYGKQKYYSRKIT